MLRALCLAALTVALALPASAQPTERHRIVVAMAGPVCQYRIATQANQQLFTVSPGDRLRLQGIGGVKATFDFVPGGGVAALSGSRQRVEAKGNGETVTVRNARGADSEHEVVINCCTDRHGNRCDAWQRATAAPADLGARPARLPGDPASGPSAGDAPDDPRLAPPTDPLLGPRMKVDE